MTCVATFMLCRMRRWLTALAPVVLFGCPLSFEPLASVTTDATTPPVVMDATPFSDATVRPDAHVADAGFPDTGPTDAGIDRRQLNINVLGGGRVRSLPPGVDCTGQCNVAFDKGTMLTLVAEPDVGAELASWTQDCAGRGTCALTMDEDHDVTATFVAVRHSLTVQVAGAGVVRSDPVGIDCGADCGERYDHGTMVTLTAAPDAGSNFAGWSGPCSGTGDCVLTIDRALSVGASFGTPRSFLTVTVDGAGSVTSVPAGIDCGTDCIEDYDPGRQVTLTAAPATGATFTGWAGDCGGIGDCTVTMDGDRDVRASFVLDQYDLTVVLDGDAGGRVTSLPMGIDCGSDCTERFSHGTRVTLVAVPDSDAIFTGWTGACIGTSGCQVDLTAAAEVRATFVFGAYRLGVVKAGDGLGTVRSMPAGINCGRTCDDWFAFGSQVSLTASPAAGSEFEGWMGDCTGLAPCVLDMTAGRQVTARFARLRYPLTVQVSGDGVVTSAPAGIDCGTDCTETLPHGTQVILTATPNMGATFSGWSGACTGTALTCEVDVLAAASVGASFGELRFFLVVTNTGGGVISSVPQGIECGADCLEDYGFGESVNLTATASVGFDFGGWAGDCSGNANCDVVMDQGRSVGAIFTVQRHPLMVQVSGSGTVSSNPSGIDCGADCEEIFDHGTVVALVATATTGATFSGWSGACTGTGSCQVTLTEAQSVTATFEPEQHELTVLRTGPGRIGSSPAGIDCGTDCVQTYAYGTSVDLIATPDLGSIFTGWSGSCTGVGPCDASMTAARTVGATFELQQFAVTVQTAGAGEGTIRSNPVGIECGTDCTEMFDFATVVTLTADPDPGSVFLGWTGDCTGADLTCQVTVEAARSVTGTFGIQQFELSVVVTGAGVVTSAPTGIDCGTDCIEAYDIGTQVTLTAQPAMGAIFIEWTGACAGAAACIVTMGQDLSVGAVFAAAQNTLTVQVVGVGGGTGVVGGAVMSMPTGISCGADCTEDYAFGTMVELSATPSRGYGFTGWSGDCTGNASCTVEMTAARNVTASFTILQADLTVALAGFGSGVVTSAPAGIDCGMDCTESYNIGTQVVLSPRPAVGSTFAGFSANCVPTNPFSSDCRINMNISQLVTATFAPVMFDLTVGVDGNGTVTSTPAGISCGTDCGESYAAGTIVTLSAATAAGSGFAGWERDCTGHGDCTIVMDRDRSVGANFDEGLLVWLPFEGDADDASLNGRDGITSGTSDAVDRNGDADSAFSFDGMAFVEVANDNALSGMSEWTTCAWINPTTTRGFQYIVGKGEVDGNNSNDSYTLYLDGNSFGTPRRPTVNLHSPNDEATVVANQTAQLNTWLHICGRWEGGFGANDVDLYINGSSVAQGDLRGQAIRVTNAPLRVGLCSGDPNTCGNVAFVGRIDEIKVWNRRLGGDEIRAEFQR